MQNAIILILSFLILGFQTAPLSADSTNDPTVEGPSQNPSPTRATIRIESRIGDGPFKKRTHLDIRSDETPTLRVKTTGATIRWYFIFADLSHNYQNANTPWQDNPYKWTGFDRIEYYRIEIQELRNQSETNPMPYLEVSRQHIVKWREKFALNSTGCEFYHSDVGTFWVQVEVEDNKGIRHSPGMEDRGEGGLSRSVFRMSIRSDDSYLGYLSALYNVPGVFGSVLSQSVHHLGADCADVLMTAWSEWKRRPLRTNYNVQMLVCKFHQVAKTKIIAGVPDRTIRWGADIQPGDFIAVSYSEDAKKYHHIGALLFDENGNGILDAKDSILHAGPDPLHRSFLKEGGFDGTVVILRP
jgi:hypothetical protein